MTTYYMQRMVYGTKVKKQRSMVSILLMINVAIFILQSLFTKFFSNLTLTAGSLLSEPWTIFTSMFMHGGFSHILFNMYALWMFGSLIEQKIGSKNFLISYLASGVAAAIAFEIYHQAMGTLGISALGASGAIMGILGLTIMLLPEMKVLFFFIIPMSMRTAGIIFALIDLFGLFNPTSSIAHIAHLGGLMVGLALGLYFLKKKKEFQKKFVHIITPEGKSNRSTSSSKTKVKQNSNNYNQTIELTQDDVDNYFKYGKL